MSEQNSISSAVFGLQNTLRDLQDDLTCLQKNDNDKKEKKKINELHALGEVNLDKVRSEFSQHINTIRNVCSQFETEVLGDVMKMGIGADPAFRKHFTHLKEQATLESSVMTIKDTLEHTKNFFEESLLEKEESKTKIETQRLEKIAQSMGLVTFVDSNQKFESDIPITTITLGGTVIVIDIDIDNNGRISKTKVTYVSETLQNDQDDRVDLMLAEHLRNHQVDLFKRNLGSLALLDRLNVKHNPIDFFLIIKNLLSDLHTICTEEIPNMDSDISNVLLEGHGIPTLYLNYPGISISYWMTKEGLNSTSWDEVKSAFDNKQSHAALLNTSRLLVSFEDSIQTIQYLPPSRSSYLIRPEELQESIPLIPNSEHIKIITETAAPTTLDPLKFIKVLPSHPEAHPVPIRFVLTLDPPVPVSDEICQKIMNVAGLSNTDSVTDVTYHSSSMSLEEMLIMDIQSLPGSPFEKDWTCVDHMPHQVYKWTETSSTSARLVSRIPFHHPVQIFNIIQCLRQQQMFNTLFKSIFNESTFKLDQPISKTISLSLQDIISASESDDSLTIEVTSIDAPNSIHIALCPPPLPEQQFVMVPFSIDIPADSPTKPVVRLHSSMTKTQRWNPRIFDEELMTQEIQKTYHIPTLIQWLYAKMALGENYLIQNKRRCSDDQDFSAPEKLMKMDID